jgi:predicted kinase
MKHVLTLEQFIGEGVYDPGILKAFFMAGGPGSGKSYVATELFDFPKGAISSVSYATGLKLVNNDNAFEKGLKDAGYSASELAKYAKDPEVWADVMKVRDNAKNLTKKMQTSYMNQRLGQVIDGTGKDYNKIERQRKIYQDLGYDTYMVFVNTSLEVAMERNRMRERKLDDDMVKSMWQEVQDNMGKFQRLFGPSRMLIVDNSSYNNKEIIHLSEKEIEKHLKTPIQNPLGKRWIQDQLDLKKRA